MVLVETTAPTIMEHTNNKMYLSLSVFILDNVPTLHLKTLYSTLLNISKELIFRNYEQAGNNEFFPM